MPEHVQRCRERVPRRARLERCAEQLRSVRDVRRTARGGALFCDRRYDTVFLYHNGAESYYAARGFRGALKV